MENKTLKELFEDFCIVFKPEAEYNNITGEYRGTYPFYLDVTHKHYEGYDAIIVGDDTEITEVGAGLFKVLDYHHEEDAQIFNAKEVLEYYCGMHIAYHLDLCAEKTLAFRKGYKKILNQLVSMINDQNDEKFNFNNN